MKEAGRVKRTLASAGFVDAAGDRLILSLKREGAGFIIAIRHSLDEKWKSGFLTNQLEQEHSARKEFSVRVEDAVKEGWTPVKTGRRANELTEIPKAKTATRLSPAPSAARRRA